MRCLCRFYNSCAIEGPSLVGGIHQTVQTQNLKPHTARWPSVESNRQLKSMKSGSPHKYQTYFIRAFEEAVSKHSQT